MALRYPIKVLVLDDDPVQISVIEGFLKDDKDYDVVSFSEPKAALEFMNKEDVNIVLLDIHLESKMGDDVLREINKISKRIDTVIVSATKQMTIFQACYRLGASGFLIKPIVKENLISELEKIRHNLVCWDDVFAEFMTNRKK